MEVTYLYNVMYHLAAGVERKEALSETDLFAGVTEVEATPTKIA